MQVAKNIQQNLTVDIEKLSSNGQGIARVDGYVIFVDGACPGDKLSIEIIKKNKSYAQAKIKEIITPSADRIEPKCKMQKVCGACQMHHIRYDSQLKIKKLIVEDAFRQVADKIDIKDVIPSPLVYEYRHKVQYPIAQTKNSKRIIAGYYKNNSHEIVNIKYCPIQPNCCDTIVDFIRNNAKLCNVSGYDEKKHAGLLRHVLIRTSSYNQRNLVVLVINSDKVNGNIKRLAQLIYDKLDNISGVCVNLNNKKTNLILGDRTISLFGVDFVEEMLCDKLYKIGPKTFFQINPATADNIFRYVKNYVCTNYSNPLILDAYAGITAFGISLSDAVKEVVSVEENSDSVELANQIIKTNNINNITAVNKDASEFFKNEYEAGHKFDITILDPPRKGCTIESLNYALKLTSKQIIYVSCNPATLARDVKYLLDNGCSLDSVQPFDMFPHTCHIENVAIISIES